MYPQMEKKWFCKGTLGEEKNLTVSEWREENGFVIEYGIWSGGNANLEGDWDK